MSKRWILPFQKGDQPGPITRSPPVLRVKHLSGHPAEARAILNYFDGVIGQFHFKCAQEYSLSNNEVMKRLFRSKDLHMSYTNLHGTEYINIEVFPGKGKDYLLETFVTVGVRVSEGWSFYGYVDGSPPPSCSPPDLSIPGVVIPTYAAGQLRRTRTHSYNHGFDYFLPLYGTMTPEVGYEDIEDIVYPGQRIRLDTISPIGTTHSSFHWDGPEGYLGPYTLTVSIDELAPAVCYDDGFGNYRIYQAAVDGPDSTMIWELPSSILFGRRSVAYKVDQFLTAQRPVSGTWGEVAGYADYEAKIFNIRGKWLPEHSPGVRRFEVE